VEIQIHLLNLLTKNSYSEKYNFRPKAGITGPQVGFLLPATYSCIFRSCSWLGLINVYKFPLDNCHLQHSSIIIQSSGMRTNSLYRKQQMAPFLGEISLSDFKYFKYVLIVDEQCLNILKRPHYGIAGSQVRFEAREPIVAFFAAVSGNSRSKTIYMIFGLKFQFTKKLQLLVLSSEMSKNIDISIYKTSNN
jgi:hypothetical protein